jgi:hypothetical protein
MGFSDAPPQNIIAIILDIVVRKAVSGSSKRGKQ